MRKSISFLLLCMAIIGMLCSISMAAYEDGQDCPICGHYHWDDYMCDSCGGCSDNCTNSDCYEASHCTNCGACFLVEQIWCEDCMMCEQCQVDQNMHCLYCNQCASVGTDVCPECGACEDCWVAQETHCLYCGECYMGSEDEELCQSCWACSSCVGDICEYCHDCEDCAVFAKEHHCEECGNCYDNVPQCESGAPHCQDCCVFCEQCEECLFEDVGDLCDSCGLCLDCCRDNAEALDCTCGEYCVESSEWEEHTCFDCGTPFCNIEQCEICGLCLECCASNSDCSDSEPMCAEDPDYEEHFCEDCGQCFHNVDMCEDCFDEGIHRCVECCNEIKAEAGEHKASPRTALDYNSTEHYHRCKYCTEVAHYTGNEAHKFNGDGSCLVCGYNNGSKSIITEQPKSVVATVSDANAPTSDDSLDPANNVVTFSVKAKDAVSYQWYYSYEGALSNGKWIACSENAGDKGVTTDTLLYSVPTDACYENYVLKCVVKGKDGKEYESNIAKLICKHAFRNDHAEAVKKKDLPTFKSSNFILPLIESDGHRISCLGEGCEKVLSKEILPHEYYFSRVLTDLNGVSWNYYICRICGHAYLVKPSEDTLKLGSAKYAEIVKIGSVEVKGIDEPKAGNTPDYTGELGSSNYIFKPYNNDYYVNGITWYDITDQKDIPVKDGKFVDGHDYKVKIHLNSKPGYEFAEKVTGTISGKVAAVLIQDNQVILNLTFKHTKEGIVANEKTQEQKLQASAEQKVEKTEAVKKEKIQEVLSQVEKGEKIIKSTESKSGDTTVVKEKPVTTKSGDGNINKEKPVAATSGDAKQEANSGEATKPVADTSKEIIWSSASSWAIDELIKANKLGVIPEIFNKEDLTKNITRKEFAHVAVKLYEKLTGNKAKAVAKNPFKDTKDEEVLKAYNLEITKGVSSDEFAPDTLINREQMATMMTRALTKAGINTAVNLEKVVKFDDDNKMNDWGKPSIYYMASIEIIKGMGDGTFGVSGNATREQALLISERSAEKFAK